MVTPGHVRNDDEPRPASAPVLAAGDNDEKFNMYAVNRKLAMFRNSDVQWEMVQEEKKSRLPRFIWGAIFWFNVLLLLSSTFQPPLCCDYLHHVPQFWALILCGFLGWLQSQSVSGLARFVGSRHAESTLRKLYEYRFLAFVSFLIPVSQVLYVALTQEVTDPTVYNQLSVVHLNMRNTLILYVFILSAVKCINDHVELALCILGLHILYAVFALRWYFFFIEFIADLMFSTLIMVSLYRRRLSELEKFRASKLLELELEANAKTAVELRKSREEALAASKAKSAFLACMSHELRTPLHGVIAALSLLDEHLPIEQRPLAQIIGTSADHLLNTINSVLDISQADSGQVVLDESNASPTTIMEEACNIVANVSANKQIRLIQRTATGVPLQVLMDKGRVRQVLVNLLGNGVKFTPKHGEIVVSVDVVNNAELEEGAEEGRVVEGEEQTDTRTVNELQMALPKDQDRELATLAITYKISPRKLSRTAGPASPASDAKGAVCDGRAEASLEHEGIAGSVMPNDRDLTPSSKRAGAGATARRSLRYTVVDTGRGFDMDKLESLFTPFVQADATIRRSYGGTGLGLSLCKQFTAIWGGSVGASSRLGQGATFWFTVPIDETSVHGAVEIERDIVDAGVYSQVHSIPGHGAALFDHAHPLVVSYSREAVDAMAKHVTQLGASAVTTLHLDGGDDQDRAAARDTLMHALTGTGSSGSAAATSLVLDLEGPTQSYAEAERESASAVGNVGVQSASDTAWLIASRWVLDEIDALAAKFDIPQLPCVVVGSVVLSDVGCVADPILRRACAALPFINRSEMLRAAKTNTAASPNSTAAAAATAAGGGGGGGGGAQTLPSIVPHSPAIPKLTNRPLPPALRLKENASAVGDRPPHDTERGASRGQFRVLYADDNPVNRKVAEMMVSRCGYAVDTVDNGELALEAVKSGTYSFVFMDLHMPVMDGAESASLIRKWEQEKAKNSNSLDALRRIPIVAVTADMSDESALIMTDSGFDSIVEKPMGLATIKDTLDRHLVKDSPLDDLDRESTT